MGFFVEQEIGRRGAVVKRLIVNATVTSLTPTRGYELYSFLLCFTRAIAGL